jgi:hypothetical protein
MQICIQAFKTRVKSKEKIQDHSSKKKEEITYYGVAYRRYQNYTAILTKQF